MIVRQKGMEGDKKYWMEKKTLWDEEGVWVEYRYFISSLKLEEEIFQRGVREH